MTPKQSHAVRVAAFVAEYRNQRVTVESAKDGKAHICGYFGQAWTHGGYADVTSKTVPVQDLQDIKAVLDDGREVTPTEYRQLVAT